MAKLCVVENVLVACRKRNALCSGRGNQESVGGIAVRITGKQSTLRGCGGIQLGGDGLGPGAADPGRLVPAHRFTADAPGTRTILAKATNRLGETQVDVLIFNPAGYHNNVVRPTSIVVT